MSAIDPRDALAAQAAAGRAYLRGAVGLLEHAAVLLAPAPPAQRGDVPELAGRLDEAIAAIRRGEMPAAGEEPAPPVPDPNAWPEVRRPGSGGGALW